MKWANKNKRIVLDVTCYTGGILYEKGSVFRVESRRGMFVKLIECPYLKPIHVFSPASPAQIAGKV